MSFTSKLFSNPRMDISREGALSDMSSLARIAVLICRIGGFITGVWAVLSIAAIVGALFYGAMDGGRFVSDGAGGILFQTTDAILTFGILSDGSPLVTRALFSLFCCRAFGRAIDFFRAIAKSGLPFKRVRARELQHIGALLVLGSLISGPVGIVSILLVTSLSGAPLSWSITDVFQIGSLAVGIIVFVFARVFEYGCILQEQDDALL